MGKASKGKRARGFIPRGQLAVELLNELSVDAVDDLRPGMRQPERYLDTVIRLDDDPSTTRESFAREIAAVLAPDEHRLLLAMSEMIQGTPGEDALALKRWTRGKTIYLVDRSTAQAVQNTDWGDTVIPSQVLRRLPHRNPFFMLSEPVRVPDDDGNWEEYYGFIVLGGKHSSRVEARRWLRCDSDHPKVNAYQLHFLGRIVDGEGNRKIMVVPGVDGKVYSARPVVGMRVVITLEDRTMKQHQEGASAEVLEGPESVRIGFIDDEAAATTTKQLAALGISLLVYACAENTDLVEGERVPLPGESKKSGAKARVWDLGFHVGRALRGASRDSPDNEDVDGMGASRTVRPHWRRAHMHRFWRGPRTGPREVILHWLPPTPVKLKPGDQVDSPTVHRL